MTPQERSVLEGFLAQLAQVRGVNKDPEAERLIAQAVEQQPDATYLVVQRALLLGQALEQAKARIAALEQGEGRGQGFLDPNASGWGNPGSGPAGYRGQPDQRRLLSMRPHTHQPTARRLLGIRCMALRRRAEVSRAFWVRQPLRRPVWPAANSFSRESRTCSAATMAVASAVAVTRIEALPTEDVTINNYYGPDEVIVDNNDRPASAG